MTKKLIFIALLIVALLFIAYVTQAVVMYMLRGQANCR